MNETIKKQKICIYFVRLCCNVSLIE